MTLLIDADWLIYSSCCACEEDTRWNEWQHTLHCDERDVFNLIENRLDVYKGIAEDKHDIIMCFTSYPTFRHEIFPDYKICLLYTSPSPRARTRSRMPSSA